MQAPIFIFSLPRSGSTLLQRILMSNKEICSVAEPWLLLPQLYALKKEGTLSEFSSLTAHWAIQDFINNLPNKEADYNASLRSFILDLYRKQCKNNERFFLDKTPRYYLIIDEIIELFPDAKFIFLFRNPIHIYASAITTWGNNRFNKFTETYNDIILGSKLISQAFEKHKNMSISINYENFVANPQRELENLSQYLGIDISSALLEDFSKQDTKGKLGDPIGVLEYSSISVESLSKWKMVFNSYIRKWFALRLMSKISENDLKNQGYNKAIICSEIKSLNTNKNYLIFKDLFDYLTSFLVRKLKLNLFFSKNFSWLKKKYLS